MQDRAGLAVAAIGGVNQRMKDLSLSHSLFSYNSAFQVNTSLKLEQKKKLNFFKKKKKRTMQERKEKFGRGLNFRKIINSMRTSTISTLFPYVPSMIICVC